MAAMSSDFKTTQHLQHAGDQAFRCTDARARWQEMTYAGALSFLRRPYRRNLSGIAAVVCGVPYDGATSNRPGARLGPRAIRAASTELGSIESFPFNGDPFVDLPTVDYGDFYIEPQYQDRVAGDIASQAREVLASGARLLALGGDHFISYPLLQAHAERHGPLALIQFDAHSDTWPDDEQRTDHGSMFLRAARSGIVDVERSIQVGIRTYNPESHGFETLTAPWVHRNGIDATIEAIKTRVGKGKAYLTFDIDVLDPAFAPGTGTPASGGLASWQALEIVRGLAGLNIVGADVVEVSPPFDHAEITALAGATVAHDILCLWAIEARRKTSG
jgi:agmatinase